MVEKALRAAHPDLQVERVVIATTGDKRPDLRFSEFTTGDRLDKGIFTKELEIALESGAIDIAVHSLKDVPTVLDPQFGIAAVLPRAPIEDVLITREGWTIQTLPSGAKIGTSSVRRIRQLLWMRPDVSCVEIRGNVPTRVRKLIAPSELDGILLAKAGLLRLGLLEGDLIHIDGKTLPAWILEPDYFLPAAGQGAVGIEARVADTVTLDRLNAINDRDTYIRTQAEREFLHILEAGCQTPVGAQTTITGTSLHMRVRVFDEAKPEAVPIELGAEGWIKEPKALASKLANLVIALRQKG